MIEKYDCVFWDFGGVITESPFDAFERYEAELGIEPGFVRRINATNPDSNAWARFERSELDAPGFCEAFEAEAAGAGVTLDGRRIIACLSGQPRPAMVRALERISRDWKTVCVTNNVKARRDDERRAKLAPIMAMFDLVVESSRIGVRKPEPRFYEIACEKAGVAPEKVVYLDDLGINLKPARAMGMHTIKVGAPDRALAELEATLGIDLRAE